MFTITQPDSNRDMFLSIESIGKYTASSIAKSFYQLGKVIKNTAKKSILNKNKKTGRIYKYRTKSGSVRRHQASAAGEAPASRTGKLWRGLSFNARSNRLVIGDSAPYASYLELGTIRIKKRPYLLPAINENRNRIRTLFKKNLRRKFK